MLNNLLLVACLCIIVALILYFFYWNRFIAAVIGQAIRILYWNQESSSIWVEIGSIHFSLLAGRILMKDVRYHSSNQTFKTVKAQIQWRYWIRRPTAEEELSSSCGEDAQLSGRRMWACRIQLSFQGVEWFLYNRTAAYENIIAQMENAARPASRSSSRFRFFRRFVRHNASQMYSTPFAVLRMPSFVARGLTWVRKQMPSFDPKGLLPVGVKIQTAAIILGNPSTPSLLVAEFRDAFGTYGIVPSRSKYDQYKQVLNLHFQSPLIRLAGNDDFIDPMHIVGRLVNNRARSQSTAQRPPLNHSYRIFSRLWRHLGLERLIMDYFERRQTQRIAHKSLPSSLPGFKKSRNLEEETPIGIDFSTHEYAVERKVLEAPALELTYYVDVVGEVPVDAPPSRSTGGVHGIGNGDTDPEWGFDLVIFGGLLRYGPWADRQRVELQHIFFPQTFHDHIVTPRLSPGDQRVWTALKIFVELRDETSLHIPFREPSKDWQWDGVVDVPRRPRRREPAFFNLAFGDRSSINYVVPMVVGPSGYESALEVHLDTTTITSSLNDICLVTAESTRIHGSLPAPVRWNAERTWSVVVYLRQPTLYLLRDHVNMMTDLGRDWISGPPTDYQKFIPMIYAFRLELHQYELNLYVNDHNIIDRPLIREENALLTLRGLNMNTIVTIPSNHFRPETVIIPFTVSAPNLVGNFSLPRWSTHALRPQKEGIPLFKTVLFNLDGSYRFFAEVQNNHVEQLKLDIQLKETVFRTFGWAIRYFLVLRENYFGSFTQFQTLSEYLNKRENNLPIGDPLKLKYRPGKNNMLEVEIQLQAQRTTLLLPSGLVGSSGRVLHDMETLRNSISLAVPDIQLQLRLHDYYMEMSLNFDRITASIYQDEKGHFSFQTPHEIFMIDGIDIVANRLFGPQPRTAVYVCIWEISVGDVRVSLSANQAPMLVAAGNAFGCNFVDLVNAPAHDFAIVLDPDVTFYKIAVKTIEATWKAGQAALLVRFPKGIKLDRNDLGTDHYKRVTSLRLPDVSVKVLLTASQRPKAWLEAAEITAEAYIDIYSSPCNYQALTRAQLAFIEEQDSLTGRTKRIFEQLGRTAHSNFQSHGHNGVYIPEPSLPCLAPVQGRSSNNIRSGHIRPPSWRLSTVANLSDTDAEEGVSEADRDARLARTRTSTPVPQLHDDNMAMSSGDESDDADLTDGDSSEDDWSDIDESSQGQEIAPLLSFYSPIVRHYSSATSGSWDGVLFNLTRENASFMHYHFPEYLLQNPSTSPSPALSDISPGEEITTVLIKCQTILLTFTPLALPASDRLEEGLKNIVPNAEICVDSLLGLCATKLATKEKLSCTVLSVDIHNATSQAIQHIPMLDETHPDIFGAKTFASPSNLDILSILRVSAVGVRFSGVFRQDTPVVTASFSEIAGSFHTSMDKRTLDVSHPQSTIFDFKCSSTSINFAQSSFAADFGKISLEIGHIGPGLVTAACLALVPSVSSHFLRVSKKIKEHQQQTRRTVIATILELSQDRPVIDPLSTIQPSYLVQSGLPQLLRTDVSFRFLYHLRNCLDKPLDQLSSSEVNVEELNSLVEARLSRLDSDASITVYHNSLGSWFETRPSASNDFAAHIRMVSVFAVRLGSLKVVVTPPWTGSSSELSIREVETDVRFKKQDLVQFNVNNPSSASQTSLRAKSPKIVSKAAVAVSLGDIDLIVVPHLMNFAQHILRVKTQLAGTSVRKRIPVDGIEKSSIKLTEVIGVVHRLQIQAAAENLVLVVGFNGLRTAISLLATQTKSLSANGSAFFEEIYLQARSPSNLSTESDHDILAALSFTKGTSNVVSRSDSRSRPHLKFVLLMNGIKLHVPRSALRLYRFVEEWRQDYLPGLEATLNALLSEIRASPQKPPHSPSLPYQPTLNAAIQLHGQIDHIEVSLQVMHGTWVSWEMHNSMGYVENLGPSASSTKHAFGVQVSSMVLNVSSRPNAADVAPSSRVKITLPPLSVAGHSEGLHIQMLVLLEFIDLKAKPSHWDTLLAVQQKFGQDFNDLLVLMQETRQKSLPENTSTAEGRGMQYAAHIRMQGFRIGLVGLSSTVFLDCQDINGGFTSTDGWTWDLGLSDLALSLAPRLSGTQSTSFNRKQRSAFVIIDINLSGSGSVERSDKNVRLSITKIHAVMQPSAIGEFGDFMDNLQAEMFERQEQRALELAAFKAKAQTILQTFDVNVRDVQLQKASWLDNLIIGILIQNVGVAFPLTHDEELQIPRSKSKESHAVRAFLFSIKAVNFTATRGETGQATMRCLCLQFVPKFRQSSPEDFAAENHLTRNCLLYPDMQAQLRTSTMGSLRKVWIKADVSGFILDIDSTIPSYVFSLIDVYRQGKERVERLSTITPRTPLSALPIVENVKPSLEKHYTAVPTSNVFSQLTFLSGKVRFYSASAMNEFKNRIVLSQTLADISDDQILDLGAEVFNLPVVSVWIEYRATPASQKLAKDSEIEPSLLVFKSTVSSSHNTLRPTLLPFLTELVSRIETRMRKVSARCAPPATLPPSFDKAPEMDIVSSMKLSFSLRIDKSTLELTCQPDVNVVAGLNWESGGFIVNISPGARKVHFSGSVGGLTIGLKHGFLSEDCVKLDARNLVFSVSFTKTELHDGESVNSVSVALDTEFLGGVRFSRLQDILCFKAVWLDRIPVLDSQMGSVEAKTLAKSSLAENTPSSRGFSTAVLLRIRQTALEVDLGQSVSRVNLDLDQIIFRTTFTDDYSEVFLYIADVSISANGNLSGRAHVPNCVFQTIRRSEESLWEDQGKYCMLELRLTSDALIADFESDLQNILHYRAEPLKLEILDDWSQTQAALNDKTRPVHLSFTITCPEIVAAITIGTIPKLLSYMNKFQANLDTQRQGAYRESQMFRVAWAPKPDNPLSAVGEAMLHSARNRFKESGVSLVVRQHMRVRLDLLRLIVFPRTMKDSEIAQFIGNDVRARLDGLVVSDSPSAERELHLSFSSMVISKYNRTRPVHQHHNRLEIPGDDDGREWLTVLFKDTTEANIAGLPSMKMHMVSEESEGDIARTLTYDFFSEFVRREGMKAFEDIYITLNMSLYAWLTVLRKNLTREMVQVKASEDWRSSMSSSSTAISPVSQTTPSKGKKKVPEPLPLPSMITDPSPRSNSMPSALIQSGGSSLSPPLSGPFPSRLASLEGTQSPLFANPLLSSTSYLSPASASPIQFPSLAREKEIPDDSSAISQPPPSNKKPIVYKHRNRQIERLTMRQLGEATPDVMHPFFMKKAGFSLEDSLPQYVHEYATSPLEEILEVLLKLYSRQLLASRLGPQNQLGAG